MLSEHVKKVKQWITENKSDVYIAVLIFLTSIISFGLGRLSALWPEKQPITIYENKETGGMNQEISIKPTSVSARNSQFVTHTSVSQGRYVASKSGKNYHYPWCQGATKINDQNKIWFQTKEEAEKAGYKPAGNCPGL